MKRLVGFLLFLIIIGGGAFYILKNYYPYLILPSKNIKLYLPLNDKTFSPIKIPSSYNLSLFADLKGELPRVLAFDSNGTLFASITSAGRVVALPDYDGNLKMDERIEVLKGLKKPHGLIFNGQYLYVTESNKVSRYQYDPYSFEVGTKENIIEFPDDGGNLPRTLKIKDNKLYISDPFNSQILESNLDGTDLKVFEKVQSKSSFFTFDETGKIISLDSTLGLTYDGDGNLLVSTDNKILRFVMFAGSVQNMTNFVTGFIQGSGEVLGRPTDLIFDKNGKLFISDDKTGLIYALSK